MDNKLVLPVVSDEWQEMHAVLYRRRLPLRRKRRPPGQAGESNSGRQRTSTRADRHALEQRAAALAPCWLCRGHACGARLNAGGYCPVNLFQEGCHYGVAVLGTQLLASAAAVVASSRRAAARPACSAMADWPARQRNTIRYTFLHTAARSLWTDRETKARGCVAQLRAVAGSDPDAPDLAALVGELIVKSPTSTGYGNATRCREQRQFSAAQPHSPGHEQGGITAAP